LAERKIEIKKEKAEERKNCAFLPFCWALDGSLKMQAIWSILRPNIFRILNNSGRSAPENRSAAWTLIITRSSRDLITASAYSAT